MAARRTGERRKATPRGPRPPPPPAAPAHCPPAASRARYPVGADHGCRGAARVRGVATCRHPLRAAAPCDLSIHRWTRVRSGCRGLAHDGSMRPPRQLPAPLRSTPFAVADALAAGVSRRRLRAADLVTPFHGVRSAIERPLAELYRPRLRPGDRFSHVTALALWDAPLPRPASAVLHVTATGGRIRPRARGVDGHRSADGRAVDRRGLPVSDAARAFLESAALLSFGDLVAVGDHLVLDPRVLDPHDLRPHIDLESLRLAAAEWRGRGARQARRAAAAVRTGVESPMESALRLLLLAAGLPEPACGYELRDGRRRIGWFDLAWPAARVIAEYDGDTHRTSTAQYERDIRRFDDAAEIDWHVVRVRSRGILVDPGDTVGRVRTALARSPDRRVASGRAEAR